MIQDSSGLQYSAGFKWSTVLIQDSSGLQYMIQDSSGLQYSAAEHCSSDRDSPDPAMKYVSCPRLQVQSHPAAAGSSEVRVRHSAPEPVAQDRDRDGPCGGPVTVTVTVRRPPRAPRPARVTPGLSSQSWFTQVIWAGLETRHSIRGCTIPQGGLIDAGQPARDRRYVAVIL